MEYIVKIVEHVGFQGARILELVTSDGGGVRVSGPKAAPYKPVREWIVRVNDDDLQEAHDYMLRQREAGEGAK